MTLREFEKRNSIDENGKLKLVNRPRRLRATPALRAMVRETELNARDFVYPLFIRHGAGRSEIRSMPGVYQLSVEEAVREAEAALKLDVIQGERRHFGQRQRSESPDIGIAARNRHDDLVLLQP